MSAASSPSPPASLDGFPSRQRLAALGQLNHVQARPVVYFGDTLSLSLSDLRPEHAAIIRALYAFLSALHVFAGARSHDGAGVLDEIPPFLERHEFERLRSATTTLRTAMVAEGTDPLIGKTFHDLRGGSFTSLCGYLEMIVEGDRRDDDMTRIMQLTRDQLKIMRNAAHDLDPASYQRDLVLERHEVELLREKWTAVLHYSGRASAQVTIDCDFQGWVSNRCLELAALDRVLYNLVNNATEHASDRQVLLRAFPIDEAEDTHLRFAVCNHIDASQRERLEAAMQGNLGQLFEGGFTTEGHGIGMGICGDIVTHSYDLRSVRDAYKRGYLGADLVDSCFVAWFHWPARRHPLAG